MGIVGTVLAVLSGLAMFVFAVQILIMAFKTSVGWGLASLFIPFAVLVFVIKHWEEAKTPALRWLACLPVQIIAVALITYGAMSQGMVAPTP
jgi:uncharacterized membrane protein